MPAAMSRGPARTPPPSSTMTPLARSASRRHNADAAATSSPGTPFDTDAECCICIEPLDAKRGATLHPCLHSLHQSCADRLMATRQGRSAQLCPLCRARTYSVTDDSGVAAPPGYPFGGSGEPTRTVLEREEQPDNMRWLLRDTERRLHRCDEQAAAAACGQRGAAFLEDCQSERELLERRARTLATLLEQFERGEWTQPVVGPPNHAHDLLAMHRHMLQLLGVRLNGVGLGPRPPPTRPHQQQQQPRNEPQPAAAANHRPRQSLARPPHNHQQQQRQMPASPPPRRRVSTLRAHTESSFARRVSNAPQPHLAAPAAARRPATAPHSSGDYTLPTEASMARAAAIAAIRTARRPPPPRDPPRVAVRRPSREQQQLPQQVQQQQQRGGVAPLATSTPRGARPSSGHGAQQVQQQQEQRRVAPLATSTPRGARPSIVHGRVIVGMVATRRRTRLSGVSGTPASPPRVASLDGVSPIVVEDAATLPPSSPIRRADATPPPNYYETPRRSERLAAIAIAARTAIAAARRAGGQRGLVPDFA